MLREKKLAALLRRSVSVVGYSELDKVRGMVARGRLRGQDKIGVRVGKVINKYKVGKHYELDIRRISKRSYETGPNV